MHDQERPVGPRAATGPAAGSTNFKGDILVVDDVPANLNLLSNMLREQGYKTRVADRCASGPGSRV